MLTHYRRLIGAVAVTGTFYGLGRYLGIEVEVEVVEDKQNKNEWQEAGQEVDDEDDEEYEEEDHALLFLPTGFTRPKPRTFYRGSDPEWQEFKKVATDPPRIQKIRSELTVLVRNLAAKSPTYVARLGKVDTSKGKVWIEFKFPDGPPIEYERPGFELTEGLEWRKATRPIEEVNRHRLNRLLYPKEATIALYEDTKRKATQSWKTWKAYIGWEENPEPETVQQLMQRIGANPRSIPTPIVPSAESAGTSPASTSPANETQPAAPTRQAARTDSPLKDLMFVLPDPKKAILDLSQFHQDFRKAFKPQEREPPRGTFLVLGLIEVIGERGRIALNVTAAYDPKQGRYVSLAAKHWNIVSHRQNPKGGP